MVKFRNIKITYKYLMAYNHNFELIETKKLIPYINNAKIHGENQIKQIASSITEFGFTNPILVDTMNNVIAGHGRLQAANKLGLNEVPCIVISGLTQAQKKALIIADNKIAENSDWDMELLSNELESIKELDFDFGDLGFDFDFDFDSDYESDVDDSLFSDDVIEDKDVPIKLSIVFDSEIDKRKLKEELLSRGFLCQ